MASPKNLSQKTSSRRQRRKADPPGMDERAVHHIDVSSFFWTLDAIDEMDILYYLDLLNYQSEKEYQKNIEAAIHILG